MTHAARTSLRQVITLLKDMLKQLEKEAEEDEEIRGKQEANNDDDDDDDDATWVCMYTSILA